MKTLIALALALTIAGCSAPTGDEPTKVSTSNLGYGVARVVDEDAGVVCWVFDGYKAGGLDCMPISDTLLDK